MSQLLTGPGGGAIISEYEELLDALLKRTVDAEVGLGLVGRLGWRCVLRACLAWRLWECTVAVLRQQIAGLRSLAPPYLQAEARRKVLDYAAALYEACASSEARQASVVVGAAAGVRGGHSAVAGLRDCMRSCGWVLRSPGVDVQMIRLSLLLCHAG